MSVTIPKNVRQMGEPEETRKIYVEDYVVTYLRQYAKEDIQNSRMAILLGSARQEAGIWYLYIRSALALEADVGSDGNVKITDQLWMHVYEEMEKYFQGQEILGWFLSTPGYAPEVNYELEKTHQSYFPGMDRVLYLEDPTEGEESFFALEGEKLTAQKGYFIFYERNEPMQQYMLEKKDGKSVDAEGEVPDRAARSFRMVVQERKEENSQKRVMTFLYGVSTCLVMVVLVIGITMINNYEKMEQVEVALQNLTQNLQEQQEMADWNLTEQELEQETVQVISDQVDEGAEIEEEQSPTEETLEEAVPVETYIIQKGDTLMNISRKFYGNDQYISEICQLNQIDDSNKIYVGEKILLPQ